MFNSNSPAKTDLPSTGKLIKSTVLAAVIAGVLLVTVVMPAEFGIDPTGIGKVTGLKQMGKIKTSVASDAYLGLNIQQGSEPIAVEKVTAKMAIQIHEKTITLTPAAWTEIKLKMEEGNSVSYVWSTNGARVNYDTHGDSKSLNINYHGYEKGSKQRDEGVLTAKFTGNHGWYWRNRTDKTITITLKTNGTYQDIFIMK